MAGDVAATQALGELRGLLAAFEWANGKCDHSCTFTVEELPPAPDIHAALVLHFGADMVEVTVAELGDWPPVLREAFRHWLFQYTDLLRPDAICALSDMQSQEAMVSRVLDRLLHGLKPGAVWQVAGKPRGFYECAWDDFAIEGRLGRYLLHLGVSD